jgi:hypothetical protein
MTVSRLGEPRLASVASWAVLAASFGLSATTWIALAELAGFTATLTVGGVTLRLAWLMPVAVDGYVVVALVLWMSTVPAHIAQFARKNTYGAAGIGILAQSAYHLLHTATTTGEAWRVVLAAIVGALPPAVAALAVHMRALIRRESSNNSSTAAAPAPLSVPDPAPARSPIADRPAPTPPAPVNDDAPEVPTSAPELVSAPAPEPVVPRPAVPSPAELASRITQSRPTSPATRPASVPERRKPSPRPRTNRSPGTPAPSLAPSPTDIPVTASDAAQLTLPVVPADLLKRATEVARLYRTEHGTPITVGQLAVRLKVQSETAAHAIAQMDLLPDNPTRPIPTVNGKPIKASR